MSEIPQTPEAVAYSLTLKILVFEDKHLRCQRKELLDIYKECLKVVTNSDSD